MTTHRDLLQAADAADNDFYGTGLDISADGLVLAVGAQGWEGGTGSNRGGVYIYDWNGSSWVARGSVLVPADAADSDAFSWDVALSEDGAILVASALSWEGTTTDQGGVYTFDWSGSAWVQRGSVLVASDPSTNDHFGSGVSLSADGSVLIVGARYWDGSVTDQGGVYTFDWSGSAWVQRGSVLTASDPATNDRYGNRVAISKDGTRLAVVASFWEGTYTDQGVVYIYDLFEGAWVLQTTLQSPSASASEVLYSASFSGVNDLLAIGAINYDGGTANQGGVYLFKKTTSGWVQDGAVITASDAASDDAYGISVSLSATGVLAVGASNWEGGAGTNRGAVYVYPITENRTPAIGSISVTGLQPAIPTPFNGVAVQGTVSVTGLQPSVTTRFDGYPTIGQFRVIGLQPKIPTPFEGTAVQGAISITGLKPSLGSGVTTLQVVEVTGRGFNTLPEISLSLTDAAYITGYGFSTAPELFGGAEVSGSAFASEVSIELIPANEFSVTGYGFGTGLSAELIPDFASGVTGRGFSTSPAIYGGAEITGRGFSSELITQTETPLSIVVSGRGFATEFDAAIIAPTSISVTGYGFSSSLQYTDISGRGFLSQPLIEFEYTASYAEAFVMNLAHKEMPVTRYTNYPFMHVARIGDKYYGFATDGIYEITGDYDLADTVPVNGTATTQETDFGIFQSKNVPFVYLSADTDSTVTPIVDGEEQPSQTTDFSGRKCKLARGSKGRYWAMRIENITNLQGLEFLPDALQRRVK